MEQNNVVDAIKAALGDSNQASHSAHNTGSNYNITINGNVNITVQTSPCLAPNSQPAASQ